MSTPIEHLEIPLGERHPPHNWEYADATAREAATGFTPDDVSGHALQLDNNTIWMLTDDDPVTWVQVGGPPGVGVGDVIGPGSSTDNAVARFNSTTGKLIQNSNLTLPDDAVSAEVGYMNIPQRSVSTDTTTVMTDRGGHIYHPTTDDNPRTWTIDSNANVPYPIGTAITFVNDQNTVTIAITSDTLVWAEDGSTGSRTLAENGIATALKVTSTRWVISGTGLS